MHRHKWKRNNLQRWGVKHHEGGNVIDSFSIKIPQKYWLTHWLLLRSIRQERVIRYQRLIYIGSDPAGSSL